MTHSNFRSKDKDRKRESRIETIFGGGQYFDTVELSKDFYVKTFPFDGFIDEAFIRIGDISDGREEVTLVIRRERDDGFEGVKSVKVGSGYNRLPNMEVEANDRIKLSFNFDDGLSSINDVEVSYILKKKRHA